MSLAARKQWLADHVQLAGMLRLDAGAVRALVRDGKSLLPIGVVAVEGEFERGEVVGCFAPDGREIARGLVNYGAQETATHPAQAVIARSRRSSATSTSPSSSTGTTWCCSAEPSNTRLQPAVTAAIHSRGAHAGRSNTQGDARWH